MIMRRSASVLTDVKISKDPLFAKIPLSTLKQIFNYFIVHKNKIFFIYSLQLML